MFEKASRLKLRFKTQQGLITTEDLWDLPLTIHNVNRSSLNDIAVELHKELKDASEVSFVKSNQQQNETVRLKFDIVKHIIDKKETEAASRALAIVNREKKEKILELINQKENQQLADQSLDDLRKLAEEL